VINFHSSLSVFFLVFFVLFLLFDELFLQISLLVLFFAFKLLVVLRHIHLLLVQFHDAHLSCFFHLSQFLLQAEILHFIIALVADAHPCRIALGQLAHVFTANVAHSSSASLAIPYWIFVLEDIQGCDFLCKWRLTELAIGPVLPMAVSCANVEIIRQCAQILRRNHLRVCTLITNFKFAFYAREESTLRWSAHGIDLLGPFAHLGRSRAGRGCTSGCHPGGGA